MSKLLRILAVVVVVLLLAFVGLRIWTKSKSPQTILENTHNELSVKVTYSQPSKRGRVIFGNLVPYGNVWRTGANEATIIEFGQDVSVAGKPLPKGSYSLWTIPGPRAWTAIFNKETGQWGTNYNEKEDILRVQIAARKHTPVSEQFTMTFAAADNGTDLLLFWDETEAIIPIRPQ